MSLRTLSSPFPWYRYSKTLASKISAPRSVGSFEPAQSEERGMRCIQGEAGSSENGNQIRFYWLVDPDDGVIVDVRFQAYGHSALIGAAEAASELLIGKNYDQARRLHSDAIDRSVRDKPDEEAFPKEAAPYLNLVVEALDETASRCDGIPLAAHYFSPEDAAPTISGSGHPDWERWDSEQRLAWIRRVIDEEVRPYIELDAGGVTVLELTGHQVRIAYQGACTTCFSATGTTLSYIQQILRAKAHPSLDVIPDLSVFH